MTDPLKAKRISHLPRINAGAVALLDSDVFGCVTQGLLEEVAADREQDRTGDARQTLDDIVRMMEFLDLGTPPPIRSQQHMAELHNSLVNDYLRKQAKLKSGPFPAPPIPGCDSVIPITNGDALREEARRMENCVFSYAPAIRAGCCYIYHVTAGKAKATVELRLDKQGQWNLAQVEGPDNTKCGAQVTKSVQGWIGQHSISAVDENRRNVQPLLFPEEYLDWFIDEVIPF